MSAKTLDNDFTDVYLLLEDIHNTVKSILRGRGIDPDTNEDMKKVDIKLKELKKG